MTRLLSAKKQQYVSTGHRPGFSGKTGTEGPASPRLSAPSAPCPWEPTPPRRHPKEHVLSWGSQSGSWGGDGVGHCGGSA